MTFVEFKAKVSFNVRFRREVILMKLRVYYVSEGRWTSERINSGHFQRRTLSVKMCDDEFI